MMLTQQLVGGTPPVVRPTPAVRFTRWTGVLYASAGIVGLALTGLTDPMSTTGAHLLVLEVNGLQNLLHLAVGVALVSASATSPEAARVAAMLTAAAFLVAGLLGSALVGSDANVLALNTAGNLAHLATATLAAVCAAASPRAAAPDRATRTEDLLDGR